ncbi:MAG: HAD-IA family hydrolase [Pusillimonas sp.]
MKHYDAVIFDWDGTLMDSTGTIVTSIQMACADLGLPVPDRQRASWVIGLSLESALYHVAPDLQADDLEHFVARYKHHFFQRDQEMPLFDGVPPLLHVLREQRVKLAVATGKGRVGLDRVLATSQLGGYFDMTRCADESHGKPHPGMLHDIMGQLGLDPESVLMVGDTTHDVQMAHNAGVDSIAVSYGAHDVPTLQESNPTVLVHSVAEMHDWLSQRVFL